MKLNDVMGNTEKQEQAFYHSLRLKCGQNIARQEVPFFRGFQHDVKPFGNQILNGWRTQRDSSKLGTFIFNKIMEKQTGIKDIRNTAYFVTHQYAIAEYHGTIGAATETMGLVFPVDGSRFITTNYEDGLQFCDRVDVRATSYLASYFGKDKGNIVKDFFKKGYEKNKRVMKLIDEMVSQEDIPEDERLNVIVDSTNPHSVDLEKVEIMVYHSLPTEYYYWESGYLSKSKLYKQFDHIKEQVGKVK